MSNPNSNPIPSAPSVLAPQSNALVGPASPHQGDDRMAYERMLGFMREREGTTLLPILVDTLTMVVAVLKALPRLRAMRAEIVALPGVDPRCVDDLEDCAHAFLYATSRYHTSTRPPERLLEVTEKATALRAHLHSSILPFIHSGIIDGRELDKYQGMKGYKIVANDLSILSMILRNEWPKLENRTIITAAEVNDAVSMSMEIAAMVAAREGAPAVVADAAQIRLLAYNLLLQRYQEARASVLFIRRVESDGDSIAPSLFAGRTKRRDTGDGAEGEDEADDVTVAAIPGSDSSVVASPGAPPNGAHTRLLDAADDAFDA